MEPIRTLIVDDEPLARENLRIRLREHPDFVVVGECASGGRAVEKIHSEKPDVVFLDIKMPDRNGFEVIDAIPPEQLPIVIFVTAYDRYALEAFRVHALDYLLKPFEAERFVETLQLCRQRVAEARRPPGDGEPAYRIEGTPGSAPAATRGGEAAVPAPHLDRLVIKGGGRVLFLKLQSIESLEAYGDYVRVHVGEKSYLVRKTLGEIESRLDANTFVRISRSAIVNLDRVQQLAPLQRGEYQVRLAGGRELKLTRTHRENLERLLGDRL